MLLEMDQQHSTATGGGFMSSFNLAPFSMSLNDAATLATASGIGGVGGVGGGIVGGNNVSVTNALLAGVAAGNNNNNNNNNGANDVCGVGSGGGAYSAYGGSILHTNNNNSNSNNNNTAGLMSAQQQQQQQQQSQSMGTASHHNMQQQQQQSHQSHQSHPHNNYSIYNFDSQYGMFSPGGYADASNQSQTQSSAGTQQQSHVSGGGVIASATNQNTIGGGGGNGYMPLLPSLTGGGGEAGSLIANVSNTASAASVGGGGGGGGGANGGNANASSCDQTEIKYCIEELCPVCGDKVSGYHYGLLTCESCKGFFKRTVQNKKVYTCVAERQCHIDKTQRKRCPFCRFQKCLEVGMKLEAVRADRMRGGRNKFGPMYKRDRARKLQIMRQRQLAIQTLRAVEGANPMDPGGYGQSYHMNIKQEIQIPQISSLTSSSPDSSPSPIAIALGQVSASGVTTALTVGTSSSIGSANGGGVGGSGGPSSGGSSSGNAGCSASNSGSLGSGSTTSNGGGGQTGANSNGSSTNSIPSTTTSSAVHNNTATDSKQWFIANSTTASPHSLSPKQQFSFDSGSNPTSTADSGTVAEPLSKKQNWKNSKSLNFPRVSPMIREFVQSVDDREWQQQLFSLLQSQSYNQCEVDVFELMCKVLDQNLFSQVDWARNTVFFKDLKVDDQMKLLQNSWSDMLVLDHLHQRIHNNLADETTLHNGQKFDLLGLGLLGVPQLSDHFNDLQHKLVELKFDVGDYICMKFLLLLNPEFADVRGITNRKTVLEGYENVQAALLDYTLTCYPTVSDKFTKLISIIPEIHAMAARGEEHLYVKHCAGSAPTQTLLMEMLHAKRK